jgi:hypothetical protein
MRRRFPQRRYTHSLALHPHRRTRPTTNVIVVIVILVQSVALAGLGWDAPAVISIIVTTVALLQPTRLFCQLHD